MFEIKDCLVICPFGEAESTVRKRSDTVLKIIRGATDPEGFTAYRSIDIEGAKPGMITDNIVGKLCSADLVIADLTGSNPNVYYEFALRLATGKPFIALAEDTSEIKFDLKDVNTILLKRDFDGAQGTIEQLRSQIQDITKGGGHIDTYVSQMFHREACSAKLFVWTIRYANGLAGHWLRRQEPAFVEIAQAFDNNRVRPEGYQNKLAEYVAFKFAQGQAMQGRLFYSSLDSSGTVAGWGIFELPGSAPLAIQINGREDGDEVELFFTQPARPMEIEPGVTATIRAFNFTVKFSQKERILEGALYHPDYAAGDPLQIGTTELTRLK